MAGHPSGDCSTNLIYHTGALGDFLTAFPAMACWRRMCPGDQILFLGRRTHGDIALRTGIANRVLDIDSADSVRFFREDEADGHSWQIQRALLFAKSGSPIESALKRGGGRQIVRQDPFPSTSTGIVDFHLSLFPGHPPLTELYRPLRVLAREAAAELGPAATSSQSCILVHPGSGGRAKVWPGSRFIELASRLKGAGYRVNWVLGPAEEGFRPPLEDPVHRNCTLHVLCGLVQGARLFIGNDSGVTHLASALGVPAIAIFGPSDLAVWRPVGGPVVTVTPTDDRGRSISDSIDKVSVEKVHRSVEQLLGEISKN